MRRRLLQIGCGNFFLCLGLLLPESRSHRTQLAQLVKTQSEFNFDDNPSERGYTRWVAGWRMAASELARRMHFPLGHQVEVWLFGGVRLRGNLHLREDLLFVEEERVRTLSCWWIGSRSPTANWNRASAWITRRHTDTSSQVDCGLFYEHD